MEGPMPSTAELERLSALLAGELSEEEARALRERITTEPELARAYRRLERLSALSSELGALDAAPVQSADEALVSRVVTSVQTEEEVGGPRPGFPFLAVAAALILLVGGGLIAVAQIFGPRQEAPAPAVVEAVQEEPAPLAPPTKDEITIYGGVLADGMIFWTPQTELERGEDGSATLKSGSVIAQASNGLVRVGPSSFTLRGEAVISTEPSSAIAHVTRALTSHPGGQQMQKRLDGFKTMRSAWAGATLLVLALDGEVEAKTPSGTQLVRKGEAWTPKPGDPAPIAAVPTAAVQQALEGTPQKSGSEPQLALGEVDPVAIREAVLKASWDLTRCYEAGLAQNPKLEGALTVRMRIVKNGGAGALKDADIDEAYTLTNPFVASCVLESLSRVTWPAPSKGDSYLITYPFRFDRRGETQTPGASLVLPPDGDAGPRQVVNPDRPGRQEVEIGGAATLGPDDAPVKVVVFSNFECSFCLKAHPTLMSLRGLYGDRVQLVYKHRPLPPHRHARMTAAAAIAAGEQGKFWDFADLLTRNPGSRDRASMERFAGELGLDLIRFRAAMDAEATKKRIDEDEAEAKRVGANGIPCFFINGREIVGARPVDHYQKVIDEELAAAAKR